MIIIHFILVIKDAVKLTKDVFNELWSTNLPGEHTGADESKQHDDNIGDAHQQWWVVTMLKLGRNRIFIKVE